MSHYEASAVNRQIDPHSVGWCHQCGTYQLFTDAPWLPIPYWGNTVHPCCVECRESEPWEMGVWEDPEYADLVECAVARHVSWTPGACETCAGLLEP